MSIFKPPQFKKHAEPRFARSWNNENFGTGQKAPSEQKDAMMMSDRGGVPMPAPFKFNHEISGAGKPEKN